MRLLFSTEEIKEKVDDLASQIRGDYQGKKPLLVGLLKGSFVFLADLVRALDQPLEVDFVRLSSYGHGTESSGRVRVLHGLKTPVRGRDVLVVEDIVDTGHTLSYFLESLARRRPASLRVCTLLDKPCRRCVPVTIHYRGFTVEDVFVVGYGIDWAEEFRYLPAIYALEKAECASKTSSP
ncbi:MAG: hypoxanthine phosphoribosyltransferase [Chloroflexota bacterium]|nr:hypoxanthine phosphoribosyltransferase [Chloroflexota bacterium]